MPETLNISFCKWLLACVVVLGVAAPGVNAWAQMNPNAPPPGQAAPANPMCPRLEAQLATIDRGGVTKESEQSFVETLRRLMADFRSPFVPELPRFTGGAVGYLGYGAASWFEPTLGDLGSSPDEADAAPGFPKLQIAALFGSGGKSS